MKSIISTIIVELILDFGACLSQTIQEPNSFPRVTTSSGSIEGFYRTSSNGRLFRAFQGIPYAEPPIGDLRFEVPVPVSSWNHVLMAKKFGHPCMQYNISISHPETPVEGVEDCLYLNIFTPITKHNSCKTNRTSSTSLPVIFFIHGGFFQSESAANYGPDYILNRDDVILVTINYRLGPLGFLSTEDEIVPGNMGLKDQVVALQWVKNNIKSFGGDPSRILISGHSAGGASVHYHYMTNLTKGLFHGGLSISGSALNCWAQTENSSEKAKKLAEIVGCSTLSNQLMVNCLKAKPARQLVEAVGEFKYWLDNPSVAFGPVVEKGGSRFTFIDRSPIDIITSGDIQDLPWVSSVVSEEGILNVAKFIANETLLEELNGNWSTIAPHLLDYNYTIPKQDHAKIAKLIRRRYLGSKPIDKSTTKQVIQMVGNRIFTYDGGKAAKLQARFSRSPVRFFYFTYRGAHSFSEFIEPDTKENYGVEHEDDLAYVFKIDFDTTSTPQDRAIQNKLINLWVSYAADLTPNVGQVDWAPVNRSSSHLNYLHIAGPDQIFMENSPNFGDLNFWDSLGFQENIQTD